MEVNDGDFPQAKARRQPHKDSGHEHCQGYVDRNGMWNNGFYCPRWGGPDEQYCCGDGRDGKERYCCPEPVPTATTTWSISGSAAAGTGGTGSGDFTPSNYIPIAIGVSIGVMVFLIGLLLVSCFVCPCCPPGQRRRRRADDRQKQKEEGWSAGSGVTARRTLSVSLEAEATSAVIAAQALVPLKPTHHSGGHGGLMVGCPASPAPSSSTTDDPSVVAGHMHCGCRWSPSTSRSTVVDVDSTTGGTVTSLSAYQSPAVPSWQTELDNIYNCSCENAIMSDNAAIRKMSLYKSGDSQIYQLYHSGSAGRNNMANSMNNHRSQSPSGAASPSALCLESFRPMIGGGPAMSTSSVSTRSPRIAALVLPRSAGLDQPNVNADDNAPLKPLPPVHYQASPFRLNLLQTSKLQQRSYGSLLQQQQQLQLEEADEFDLQLDPTLAEVLAAAAAEAEADGQRRDSGVLVEDNEASGDVELSSVTNTNTSPTTNFPASSVLPMPSLVSVDRIVGRMTVNSR